MTEESFSEMYYEKIKGASNPIPLFVAMFTSLFNCNNKDQLYSVFARLYKVYDKDIIYFSILDCYDIEDITTNKPYGIIAYFCKKRLENKYKFNSLNNLDKVATDVLNKKQKKLKIPNLEEDN
jgi:hypothetical protein